MSGSVPFPISLTAPYTIWTPAQWIAAWQSKADVTDPALAGEFVNISAAGSILVGTGTPTGLPYVLQSAWSLDPSVAGTSGTTYRLNATSTTLNYITQDTTNIVDGGGWFSQVFVNGPHVAAGEINIHHSYLQINSGAVVDVSENVEASMHNFGSLGSWDGVLSIPWNESGGTSSGLTSYHTYLTNDNTAAGSVTNFTAYSLGAMQGAGSLPTFYYAIHFTDPNASINTLGGVNIGSNIPVAAGSLNVNGADNSSGTFSLVVKSQNGTNLLYVNNAGNVFVPNTLQVQALTLTAPVQLPKYTVSTLPSASGRQGQVACVTDATAPTYLGALTGGGTVTCQTISDGTTWRSC